MVGRKPRHAAAELACLVLFFAWSCYSSICPHHLSTAWLVSLVLSYGLQVVTREVHRSSLRRLICPAQDHFIFLTVLVMSMTFVLSVTQMLVFLCLYVMLSIYHLLLCVTSGSTDCGVLCVSDTCLMKVLMSTRLSCWTRGSLVSESSRYVTQILTTRSGSSRYQQLGQADPICRHNQWNTLIIWFTWHFFCRVESRLNNIIASQLVSLHLYISHCSH